MGWFKKIWKKAKKIVKKVIKSVKKVAKKVWKGVKKVASKIGKGIKKVGKAIGKLGPLASIAIGFIPGFQALWANAGIWGAIGKGALTGFVTSGGKLKGALVGAVGGGIGYAAAQGASAFKQGYDAMGSNASISDKITGGLKSVGSSTSEGFSNMYSSADNLLKGGDGGLNYLQADVHTGEMKSIYQDGNVENIQGADIYNDSNKKYMESFNDDTQKLLEQNKDVLAGRTPRQVDEILEYAKRTGENIETAEMLWEGTGGPDLDQSFDYTQSDNGNFRYTGEGLQTTLESGGTSVYGELADKASKNRDLSRNKDFSASTPKNPLGNLGAGDSATTPYASLLGQDTGTFVSQADQSNMSGKAGGLSNQLFDVRKLGLMQGSDFASIMSKSTHGLT